MFSPRRFIDGVVERTGKTGPPRNVRVNRTQIGVRCARVRRAEGRACGAQVKCGAPIGRLESAGSGDFGGFECNGLWLLKNPVV